MEANETGESDENNDNGEEEEKTWGLQISWRLRSFGHLFLSSGKQVQRYFRRKSSVQLETYADQGVRWRRKWRSPAQSILEVEPVLKTTNLCPVTEAENTWHSSYGIFSSVAILPFKLPNLVPTSISATETAQESYGRKKRPFSVVPFYY